MKLSVREEAIADAIAIRSWLHERSPAAASRFDTQLTGAMALVRDYPRLGTAYLSGYRRLLFFRGRFMVIYSLTRDTVIVRNVADAKRRPGYWLDV
jgi:plasmid stabilization system protein ParE